MPRIVKANSTDLCSFRFESDVNGEVRLPDGDSSFTLDNVEFADASDKEDSLPDAMTSYEADRLLSSRCV